MADWEETATSEEDRIIGEAHTRWESCNTWYSISQRNWLDDWKFGNADSVNGYQWPNIVRTARIKEQRPVLTINKTEQHCTQVINKIRRNMPEVKARPTGGGASFESSRVIKSVIRHIMYHSKTEAHIAQTLKHQVFGGVGYLRVKTDYLDDTTFDQEITVESIPDPLAVYIDLDAKQPDKSDARYALVFTDINRKEFDRKYPKYKQYAGQDAIAQANSWITHENVRIAEYYRVTEKPDKLYAVTSEQGQVSMMRRSELRKLGAQEIIADLDQKLRDGDPTIRERDTIDSKIEYYFIVGKKIVTEETTTWPGKWIPIIPVIGNEFIVEGVYDVKGVVRSLYDPQRMYNYWASAATEFGALQSKTPYIAPAEAVEEYEQMWNTANVTNHSVLIYKQWNDDGQELNAPARQEPPQSAPAAVQGMQIAANEFAMVSGQVLPDTGQRAQPRSAAAVDERVEEDDDATYHYRGNLGIALVQVGRIILDLLPKIYDTQRIVMAMADDGGVYEIMIDPNMQKAAQIEKMTDVTASQKVMLNPNVGKYEVEIDAGPSWGTMRQETFKALSTLLAENPGLTNIIGDLMLQSTDFHLAEEAAMRLRRMVPPQALGTGPSAQEQALQQQVAKLTDMLTKSMEQVAMGNIKAKGREEAREIDAFQALTDRLRVVIDGSIKASEPINPQAFRAIVDEAIADALKSTVEPTEKKAAEDLKAQLPLDLFGGGAGQASPPIPGAKQGADQGWYMRNFARSPQYSRVM